MVCESVTDPYELWICKVTRDNFRKMEKAQDAQVICSVY